MDSVGIEMGDSSVITTGVNNHRRHSSGSGSSGDDGNKLRELVRWRVQHADATFDFGPYDTDLDGFVDLACLVVQGLAVVHWHGNRQSWPRIWPLAFALRPVV